MRAKEYLNDANTGEKTGEKKGEKKNNGNYNYRNYILTSSENETNLEDYNVHDVLRAKDATGGTMTGGGRIKKMMGGLNPFMIDKINNSGTSNNDIKKQIYYFNQYHTLLMGTTTIFYGLDFKNGTGKDIVFSSFINLEPQIHDSLLILQEKYNEIKTSGTSLTVDNLEKANEYIVKCIDLIYKGILTKIIDKYEDIMHSGSAPVTPDEATRLDFLKNIKNKIDSKKPINRLKEEDMFEYLKSFQKLLTQIVDDRLTKNFKNITNIANSSLLEDSIKILEEILKKNVNELQKNLKNITYDLENLYKKFNNKEKILYSEFKDRPISSIGSANYKFIKILYLKYYIEKIIQLKYYITILPTDELNTIIDAISNDFENKVLNKINTTPFTGIQGSINDCITLLRDSFNIKLKEKTEEINKKPELEKNKYIYIKNKLDDLIKVIDLDIFYFDDFDFFS